MKTLVCLFVLALSLASISTAKTVDDYVAEAEQYKDAGELAKAIAIMTEATSSFPDDARGHAYLGLYKGMQAGQTENYMEAGQLVSESFADLNKALEIDPAHLEGHLFRGIMGVSVPEFFGVLDQGIADLEFVTQAYEKTPDEVSQDVGVTAYDKLGDGYIKKRNREMARGAWQRLIEIAPDAPVAEAAREKLAKSEVSTEPFGQSGYENVSIDELKQRLEADPENVDLMVGLGKAYMDAGELGEAQGIFRKAIELDPENANAYKWLGNSVSMSMSGEIYDERIHEDTEWATNLVFEVMRYLDKAVELAPDDLEARYLHGMMAIQFPFFAGKLDDGLENLQIVLDSGIPDDVRAAANFWLGYGYRKKAMTHWIEVVKEYPEEDAARMVFDSMLPPVRHFDPTAYDPPIVTIDFVLGFRDELPPQTVVWVETEEGEFLRTLYISGFSGHAREVQVVLPVYASTAKYADVDACTGASIDIGEHIYTWDLKDTSGARVKDGTYVIKVEVMHWPSMQYQLVEARIAVGKTGDRAVTEEGDFIPYLEVNYLP
jgi:tetratricopeptide (TPR) repeat protein